MNIADQLAHKAQLIIDLRLQEDLLNKQLSDIEKLLKFVQNNIRKQRKALTKSISHNMRFRNKLINEICELKKQL